MKVDLPFLPSGFRSVDTFDGTSAFTSLGLYGVFWGASVSAFDTILYAYNRALGYDHEGVSRSDPDKQAGFSIRCVRD